MFAGSQCLVTGATGFIGRHVTQQLLAHEARVRVFCRDATKARRLFGAAVEIVAGDLRTAPQVRAACRGVNLVIHVGGAFLFGRRARRLLMETNLEGTRHLLEAARDYRVERFVHISSSGIMAGGPGLLTERDFPLAVSAWEPYRRSKWLAERAVLQAGRDGLPVTIASPASPLGAGDETPTPTGRIVLDFLNGRFPASARVGMNFVHVADLASGILAVARTGRLGERYLLGHHNVWLDEFLQVLANVVGRARPRWRVPLPLVAAAGALGELTGGSRVCWETAAHARRRQWFDFAKAADELGWRATRSLEHSVGEAVEWFRQPAAVRAAATAGADPALAESNVVPS